MCILSVGVVLVECDLISSKLKSFTFKTRLSIASFTKMWNQFFLMSLDLAFDCWEVMETLFKF